MKLSEPEPHVVRALQSQIRWRTATLFRWIRRRDYDYVCGRDYADLEEIIDDIEAEISKLERRLAAYERRP